MKDNKMLLIRPAVETDAETIRDIYSYYVENTAVTYEIVSPDTAEMKKRMAKTQKNFPYMVAEKDGHVIGYCYAGPYHERAAYRWCAELSIYLAPDVRGQGIGRALYSYMENELKEMGYLNLYACIAHAVKEDRYLHNDSEAFHGKMGFKRISHSHKCAFKFGTWYDMVWMEKMIGRHMVPPKEIKKN